MPVVVVVVREHRKDFFANKESRLAMREFFRRLWQSNTGAPHTSQMFITNIRFSFWHAFALQKSRC
jgi:hypothetical protein